MALGFAGKIMAASMLTTDYQVLLEEQKVLIDDHEIDLDGNDFSLVFDYLYLHQLDSLAMVLNVGMKCRTPPREVREGIVDVFKASVTQRIANGLQG